MSEETIQLIIARAVTDVDFRELLFNDSGEALKEFELSEDEHQLLSTLSRERFDAVQQELAERLSKAGFGFGGIGRGASKLSVDGGQSWRVFDVLFTRTDEF